MNIGGRSHGGGCMNSVDAIVEYWQAHSSSIPLNILKPGVYEELVNTMPKHLRDQTLALDAEDTMEVMVEMLALAYHTGRTSQS